MLETKVADTRPEHASGTRANGETESRTDNDDKTDNERDDERAARTPPQTEPPQMPKVPKSVPEAITGATTAAIGKVAVDASKQDVAPNGVAKIYRREWSDAKYE